VVESEGRLSVFDDDIGFGGVPAHAHWQIFPWDTDLDLQVSEETIHFLAKYYNMTEYHYSLPGLATGRDYLLEVNSHYTFRGVEDKMNVIDARWIDTETGLFIDVSTVRKNYTAIAEGVKGALMCKDKHHYLVGQSRPTLLACMRWHMLTRAMCRLGRGVVSPA
jgi:hypothetical protein